MTSVKAVKFSKCNNRRFFYIKFSLVPVIYRILISSQKNFLWFPFALIFGIQINTDKTTAAVIDTDYAVSLSVFFQPAAVPSGTKLRGKKLPL